MTKPKGRRVTKPKGRRGKPNPESNRLRSLGHGRFELAPPSCVRERVDDVAEVHEMIAAGEIELACDELRWLLEGCSDFLEVHVLLAQIAWDEGQVDLARGHFGYAHAVGRRTLGPSFHGQIPYEYEPNRPLLEAGVGLARCLAKMGKKGDARRVLEEVLAWDISDPLGVQSILGKPGKKSAR